MPKKWTAKDLEGLNVTGDTGRKPETDITADLAKWKNPGSHGKSTFDTHLTLKTFEALGLPTPVTEHRFHADRKWRFDFAWKDHKIALEVEGGIFTGGAHGSVTGKLRDIDKYNAATALGWCVLRALPSWLPGTHINDVLLNHLQTLFALREKQLNL